MTAHEINSHWSAGEKTDLLRQMIRIRAFEQIAMRYFMAGKMGGWLLLSTGQEMIAAVVRSLMAPEDHSISGPRGMGHALASGMDMGACMAELYGKVGGSSKGKGGAFSFFDPVRRFWGCHGVAAAQVPLAAGLAYALKYREVPGVVFCFLGDGAMNQGVFHESMNLAGLQGLPMIYVVENNGFSWGTSVARSSRFRDCLAKRAEGYDMDWDRFAGEDPYEMRVRISAAIRRAREECRPTLLEIETYRYHGASVADSRHQIYRTREQIQARKDRDPLMLWRRHLTEHGILSEEQAEAMKKSHIGEAQAAAEFAEESRPPRVDEILQDVYWETDHGTEASRIGRHFFGG